MNEAGGGPFEAVRDEIKEVRKPRMRKSQFYLCDACDKSIEEPDDGFVIWGNVYNADPVNTHGYIGNNFPPENLSAPEQVKKTVLCKGCFLVALGLAHPPPSSFGDKPKHWIRKRKRS